MSMLAICKTRNTEWRNGGMTEWRNDGMAECGIPCFTDSPRQSVKHGMTEN